jgi:hypothetical protein
MKSIVLNAVLCVVALGGMQGCTDKDREMASRKSNGLETFDPGKPLTDQEVEAWKAKQLDGAQKRKAQ